MEPGDLDSESANPNHWAAGNSLSLLLTLSVSLSFCISSLVCTVLSLVGICIFNSLFLSISVALALSSFPFHSSFPIHSTFSVIFPSPSPGQALCNYIRLALSCCLGEASFPGWLTVCFSLCRQAGSLWNSCNHTTTIYRTRTAILAQSHTSLPSILSLSLGSSHNELVHEYELSSYSVLTRDHPFPETGFLVSFCWLFLTQGFRVSITFSADKLCAEPSTLPYPPKTSISPSLWPHLSHSPCLCLSLLFECPNLSLLSRSVSFSPFLSICTSQLSFSVSVIFSYSLLLASPQASPPAQASLLPGDKSPSFQPHGSIPQGLARVSHPSLALSLLIMLPSQSLFVCLPSSLQDTFFL